MEEPPTDVWRVAKSFEIGAKSAQAAALVFERTELAAKVGPTETSKAFEFAFKNHGARTVRINDITSTCGCISVNADTKTVAPGESGKITAVLDIGTLSGDYRQDILITSDDPGLPQTYLTIRAQVEPVFIVQPSAVKWSKHAENLPKMIQVRVNAEVPVTELRPPNDDDFAIEVSKGQSADGDWVISIRPKSQKDLVKSLVFSSDAGIGRRSSFKIVVVVQ